MTRERKRTMDAMDAFMMRDMLVGSSGRTWIVLFVWFFLLTKIELGN